ncbi:MAG: MASE1 domain-containing protein [Kofleriaceae bacterium]
MSRWVPTVIANVGLAFVYVVIARFGLSLESVDGFATLVWAPTGIALVAVLVLGYRVCPGIAAGAVIINVWNHASVPVACGVAIGNTLEAACGAYLLQRLDFDRSIVRLRDVLALVVVALGTPVISATIGAVCLHATDAIPTVSYSVTWRTWWLGDAIGDLVVAPFLLVWIARRGDGLTWGRATEVAALAVTTLAILALVFGTSREGMPFRQPYMMFPVILWAAIRFEQRGAVTISLATCAMAIYGTITDRGPFASDTLHQGLMHAQAFMAVLSITGIMLAAAISERRRALQVREDFLSIASHELRTPLSALVVQLDRLALKPTIAKVDAAKRSTRRLSTLIDALLDVTRIASHQIELHRTTCDLSDIARDVVAAESENAARNAVDLRLRVDGPVVGSWDRVRIEQVLTNLVSNAIKYGPAAPVEVEVEGDDDTAVVSVRDHGIGIPADDLERIFVRFERAVPLQQYGGLGLGLFIAKQIVEAHGGEIHVATQPGRGSVFSLDLPRDTA